MNHPNECVAHQGKGHVVDASLLRHSSLSLLIYKATIKHGNSSAVYAYNELLFDTMDGIAVPSSVERMNRPGGTHSLLIFKVPSSTKGRSTTVCSFRYFSIFAGRSIDTLHTLSGK
jgi:hypothetical protein